MTWTAPTPAALDADPPVTGTDRPILEAYLAWQRSNILSICAGLTAEQMALRPLPATNLSLLGLVRHLAKVERTWFRLRATATAEPFYDPALGKDHDFEAIDPADAPGAVAALVEEWKHSDAAVAGMSFEDTFESGHGPWSLRMMYVHLIGEYSRHNGHADLLREHIDGVTGR